MPTDQRRLQQRIRQQAHRERERALITARKVAAGCLDCGEKHPAVLQFHHLNPKEKKARIAYMVSTNADSKQIEQEISKCVVLCMNCHTKRHYVEQKAKADKDKLDSHE